MENKKEKCEKQKRKRKKNKTKKAAPLERVGEVRERVPRTPAYHVPRTDPLSQRSLEGSLSRQTWSQVVAGPSRLSLSASFSGLGSWREKTIQSVRKVGSIQSPRGPSRSALQKSESKRSSHRGAARRRSPLLGARLLSLKRACPMRLKTIRKRAAYGAWRARGAAPGERERERRSRAGFAADSDVRRCSGVARTALRRANHRSPSTDRVSPTFLKQTKT